jgi:hypothetical protein
MNDDADQWLGWYVRSAAIEALERGGPVKRPVTFTGPDGTRVEMEIRVTRKEST